MLRFLPPLKVGSTYLTIDEEGVIDRAENADLWRFILEVNIQPGAVIPVGVHCHLQSVGENKEANYQLHTKVEFIFRGYVDPTRQEDLPQVELIVQFCGDMPVYLAGCYIIGKELWIMTRNLLRSKRHDDVRYLEVAANFPVAKGAHGKIVLKSGVIKPEYGLFGHLQFFNSRHSRAYKDQSLQLVGAYEAWKIENELMGIRKSGDFKVRDVKLLGPAPWFETRSASHLDYKKRTFGLVNFIFSSRYFLGVRLDNLYHQAAQIAEAHTYFKTLEGGLTYAIEFARKLAYLHNQGVAHCDLSASNVLMYCDEKTQHVSARILDFGLSTNSNLPSRDQLLGCTVGLGTDRVRAPETFSQIVNHADTTTKSDIFTAGILIVSYILGKPDLLEAIPDMPALLKERKKTFPEFMLREDFPQQLEDRPRRVAQLTMHKDPNQRIDANKLVELLEYLRRLYYVAQSQDHQQRKSIKKFYQAACQLRNTSIDETLQINFNKSEKLSRLKAMMRQAVNEIPDDPVLIKIFTRVMNHQSLMRIRRKEKLKYAIAKVFMEYDAAKEALAAKWLELKEIHNKMLAGTIASTSDAQEKMSRIIRDVKSFQIQIDHEGADFDSLVEQNIHMQRKLEKLYNTLRKYFELEQGVSLSCQKPSIM